MENVFIRHRRIYLGSFENEIAAVPLGTPFGAEPARRALEAVGAYDQAAKNTTANSPH